MLALAKVVAAVAGLRHRVGGVCSCCSCGAGVVVLTPLLGSGKPAAEELISVKLLVAAFCGGVVEDGCASLGSWCWVGENAVAAVK